MPDFLEVGKHYLEANDSAGNTFKATAKPVLIGTAVVGATTMIFALILTLEDKVLAGKPLLHLQLTDAPVLLGFICGAGRQSIGSMRRLYASRHHVSAYGRGRIHQKEYGFLSKTVAGTS